MDLSYVTPTEKEDGIEMEYYGLACSLADLLLFPKKEKALSEWRKAYSSIIPIAYSK